MIAQPENVLLGIAERYERVPALRGLIQLIPLGVGSAFDSALSTHLSNLRRRRLTTFFDALAEGSIDLTPQLIESEAFLHSYFVTVRAALNTRREEKIRLFGQLLRSAAAKGSGDDFDEFEEFLAIIDDLSYREFRLLTLINHYSSMSVDAAESKDDLRRTQFLAAVNLELHITEEDLGSHLMRLQRSGLFAVASLAIDHRGGPNFAIANTAAFGYGELTPRYHQLIAYLRTTSTPKRTNSHGL